MLLKYCSIIFCLFSNNIIGQITVSNIITSSYLPSNINWEQIITYKETCFVIGFDNHNAHLYNIQEKDSKIIPTVLQNKFTFIADDKIYFGPVAKIDPKNINNYKIMNYTLNGDPVDSVVIPSLSGLVIGYSIFGKTDIIYYLSIELEEFQKGISKGIINGGIFNNKNVQPIIAINYKPTQSRIPLPIMTIRNKIYLALENIYNIDVYSMDGNKLGVINNPNFIPQPYTIDEIKLLSPMEKLSAKADITYPLIIKKISVTDSGVVFVTRIPRPGENNLIIDKFNSSGKYIQTIILKLEAGSVLIDVCLTTKKYFYCLLLSKISREYNVISTKLE